MKNNKMVIIDGNSLINRAYYALPILSTKDGIYTNAVYGFVNMLNKIIEDYSPEYITVAFDRKAPTFRHLEFDNYKAGRKKMPDELVQQMPILKEVLKALRIHTIEIDGFEADDLIGTLVKFSENNDINPIVVTGDKDALQLASDKTMVLITKKGISSLEIYDENEIMEKYGLKPLQIIDLKGLMGDKSDNIPGVPGIGEKTAIKLIKEFHSIENLIDNLEQLSSAKLRERIEENVEQAMLSKRLATIVVNVPVAISLEEIKYQTPDTTQLISIFKKLEFHSLISKINKDENESLHDKFNHQAVNRINSVEGLELLKKTIQNSEALCIKVLSESINIYDDPIIGIAFCVNNRSFFVETYNNELLYHMKEILEDTKVLKYGHQIKRDFLALKNSGINLKGIRFDSSIALYLLEPTRSTYDISDLSAEYLSKTIPNEEYIFGKGKNKKNLLSIEKENLIEYGINWCNTVNGVREIFIQQLNDLGLDKLYYEVEIPLIEVLADMEYFGFTVDKAVLKSIGDRLNIKIDQITLDIFQYSGEEFNINSPKQLGEVLFEKLNLPTIKKTKTGYSTNVEVLEKLQDKHPIISKIIEYRQFVKLKSTYIDGLTHVINNKTNKIHSSFNQTVASTGRISSTEPNLQNIPIRLEVGREIRRVFVPSSDDYYLLDADYSQIELRVLAHISKDNNLIEAFHTDQDIHTATAAKVFGVQADEVTSLQRNRAKAVNFGIVYGISDYGLSENLHITRKEAQKYIDEYFKMYQGVKKYMDNIVLEGKENGYVVTLLNRIRYIPELKSKNYNIRSFGERTAMNTPIQGSAADIIKIAMVKVYNELKNRNLKSKLILQVHDELIVEVYRDEINEVKDILKRNMENAVKLDVPLKVDMNIGSSWYDTK